MAFLGLRVGSMFHRRLLLLSGLIGLGMVAPVLQLARWTIRDGERLREQAEGYLSTWRWLPTTRGKILDRKGRVLAEDRPSFDIAVDYRVITGQWAYSQAYARAKRLHADEWSTLNASQRRELAERYEPDFLERLNTMWDELAELGGVPRDEVERRKEAIKEDVQRLAARVRSNRRAQLEKEAAAAGVEAKIKPRDIDQTVIEEVRPHVLLRQVNDRVAFAFLRRTAGVDENADESRTSMPGVSVIDVGTREYPMETVEVAVDRSSFPAPLRSDDPATVRVEGVATHILGWMRHRVYKEDNWDDNALPRAALLPDGTPDRSLYLEGESIGQTGMERGAEPQLRGLRGIQTTKLDTQQTEETPAEAGKDVTLTIDAQLQARIQALFAPQIGLTVVQPWHTSRVLDDEELPRGVPRLGEPLAGSAVVIEIATGEILAMVSAPSFTHEMAKNEPDAVFRDQLMMASVNRAVSQPYAPGSIVKPLVLCAAVSAGKYSPEERIACNGHFYPNQPNMLQCWTKKQFHTNHTIKFGHDLDGKDAINGSCNIFFYEMGRRLGGEAMVEWFAKFGVGSHAERWNLGLGDEYVGSVPSGKALTTDGAVLMGIGQGPIAWTPLHAADAYATLGRAGIRIIPRLRKDVPARTVDLHLDARGVEQAMRGLAAAVRDDSNGTAHHITVIDPSTGLSKREDIFNVMQTPGISVWGKSGTADASALVARDSEGNRQLLRDGDHAWCVFLVGDEGIDGRAKYAVSVVADYGGSGGRVAGPIGNQIVRALMAEGYLKNPVKKDDPTQASAR